MFDLLLLNTKFLFTLCDVATPWQTGFQDPATNVAEAMLNFHFHLMTILIFVGSLVLHLLSSILDSFREHQQPKPWLFIHHATLEIIWTIFPAIILLLISIPSFSLLYSLEDFTHPELTIKIIGHQWYLEYSYEPLVFITSKKGIVKHGYTFDSFIVSTKSEGFTDIKKAGSYRLLETDCCFMLPEKTHLRLLVTSRDVLHSWAVPSFGIKVDACPGRLTQTSLFVKREGIFYGQCSEICGVNHGFMPIVVVVRPTDDFIEWRNHRYDN